MNSMKSLLKKFLFYLLLYLRPFFRFAARLVGGFFFLGGISFMIFNHQYWKIGVLVTSVGFVLFVVRMFYDEIIKKVLPKGQSVFLNVG